MGSDVLPGLGFFASRGLFAQRPSANALTFYTAGETPAPPGHRAGLAFYAAVGAGAWVATCCRGWASLLIGADLPKGWPSALFIRRPRRSRSQGTVLRLVVGVGAFVGVDEVLYVGAEDLVVGRVVAEAAGGGAAGVVVVGQGAGAQLKDVAAEGAGYPAGLEAAGVRHGGFGGSVTAGLDVVIAGGVGTVGGGGGALFARGVGEDGIEVAGGLDAGGGGGGEAGEVVA